MTEYAVWLKRRRWQTALLVFVLAAIAVAISYVEYRPPIATPPGVVRMHVIPVTRENWIDVAWPDGAPVPWTNQEEAELPKQLRKPR